MEAVHALLAMVEPPTYGYGPVWVYECVLISPDITSTGVSWRDLNSCMCKRLLGHELRG